MQATTSNYFFIHTFEEKFIKTFYADFFVLGHVFLKTFALKYAYIFEDRVWFI